MKFKSATRLVVIMAAFLVIISVVIVIPKVYNRSYNIQCTYSVIASKTVGGFYCYVLSKGISIRRLSESKYRILHYTWSCDIDTSIAKNFKKQNISWLDMFETNVDVLSNRTVFSPYTLHNKMGVLPEDGTPVTLVARQGNVNIPDKNVIIRFNNHGPREARTTMIMTWSNHVVTIASSAREQPDKEMITWFHWHYRRINNGLWNTSIPLVIPEDCWHLEDLKYYRGPLFFMKGAYNPGRLAESDPLDFIGLSAINRVAHLRGAITTVGYSTCLDKYNKQKRSRFILLAHKLAWAYFVVKEETDIV